MVSIGTCLQYPDTLPFCDHDCPTDLAERVLAGDMHLAIHTMGHLARIVTAFSEYGYGLPVAI